MLLSGDVLLLFNPLQIDYNNVGAAAIRKLQSLTKIQKEWLRKRLRKADFGEKMRLHYYLGVILCKASGLSLGTE